MKLLPIQNFFRRGVLACVLVTIVSALPVHAQGKPSIAAVYEAGRQAFFRKDFAAAKPHFEKVLRAKPNHIPSRSMLNTILEVEKKAGAKDSMLGWAKRTIIPSINVEDAPIEEVIAFLRVKSRAITGGKWEPNFVLRKSDGGEVAGLTLAMRKVPVEYVVRTMAEMSGLAVRYEEHAITIAPKELLPPEPDVLNDAKTAAADRRREKP